MQLKNFLKQINDLWIELCWCHWRRLGAYSQGPINHCSTDPEALILLTCATGHQDKRLLEIMGQWIAHYSHLIPIDRIKSMFDKTFQPEPPHVHAATLSAILKASLPEGEQKRWKHIFEIADSQSSVNPTKLERLKIDSRKKLESHEKIIQQNLQLTLRYLFGPGSRADIICAIHVLSKQKHNPYHLAISAPQLARWLHYNRSSIHRILVDLSDGGFIQKTIESENGNFSAYESVPNQGLDNLKGSYDKAYIDWFPIVVMALKWNKLETSLEKIKADPLEKSPILKVWLYQTWIEFQKLGRAAYLPIKYPPIPKGPVEEISLEGVMSGIVGDLESGWRFVCSGEK